MDLSRYEDLNEFVSKVAVPQSGNTSSNNGQLDTLQGSDTAVNKVDVFSSSGKEKEKSSSDIGATIASIAKIAAMFA